MCCFQVCLLSNVMPRYVASSSSFSGVPPRVMVPAFCFGDRVNKVVEDLSLLTATHHFDVDNPHPRIQVVERNDHNHPDDSAMTEAISFRQQLQEEVAADPTRPPRRIYNTQVAQIHCAHTNTLCGDRPKLPSYLSVRASMQRTRNANIPAIPRNVARVAIDGPWAQTWLQDRFLQNLDNYLGIAVFATEDNLLKLRECRVI